MKTLRLELRDLELHCHDAGSGAPPLILLHGFTGHRDDFVDPIPRLAEGRRVLAPDLRGHGGSRASGGHFTFERLEADLLALLDALSIDRCHLPGHSFGGMVALRFVLAHPDRIASFIPMSTSPFAPPGSVPERIEKAGQIAVAKGMPAFQELVERAARNNPDPGPSDRQVAKWAERYWRHHRRRYLDMDPVAYGALGAIMVKQRSLVPRLREIDCATGVLVGSDDGGFLSGADAFEQGIAGAVRETIPDAGHHPHVENPEAFHAALERHLGRTL